MASAAFGTLMQLGNGGGPETFVTIAEVKDITPPQLTLDTEDVTNHSSPGGWEEFIATIKRSGTVSFAANWVPSNATQSWAAGVLGDLNARTKRNFKIVFPEGTVWTFAAFVTNFNPAAPVAGSLGLNVTLKPTGQMTLA